MDEGVTLTWYPAAMFPGHPEACDSADNDCNGVVDDGVTTTWYADVDADGFGAAASPQEACTEPLGCVDNAGDCDDSDATVSPSDAEVCDDGLDDDCDGDIDTADTDCP